MAERAINFMIDAEIYKRTKIKVAMEEITLKDYLTYLIMKDLSSDTGKRKM